jgi:succinate dehydrogenase / fumarate reductase iron-sulfur subunit
MVRKMDEEGFGNCSNHYECEAVCPANIPISVIGQLNRDYPAALVKDSVV